MGRITRALLEKINLARNVTRASFAYNAAHTKFVDYDDDNVEITGPLTWADIDETCECIAVDTYDATGLRVDASSLLGAQLLNSSKMLPVTAINATDANTIKLTFAVEHGFDETRTAAEAVLMRFRNLSPIIDDAKLTEADAKFVSHEAKTISITQTGHGYPTANGGAIAVPVGAAVFVKGFYLPAVLGATDMTIITFTKKD